MEPATVSQTQNDSTATELARRIALAHGHYSRLCCQPAPDDIAADVALFDYCSLLGNLAALEAAGPADVWAKAAALETCIVNDAGQPGTIEGDFGLAVSLLRDLRRLTAWSGDASRVHSPARLIEEPIGRTLARLGQEPRAAARV